jgi:heterodisulfide reductase subunit A-like polyferredoxin
MEGAMHVHQPRRPQGVPEQIGALRNHAPNHGKWENERQRATAFENEDPVVLIIGGGHSGLDIAARLKAIGIRALVIERNARIGVSFVYYISHALTQTRIIGVTAMKRSVSMIQCSTTTCHTSRASHFVH